MRELLSFYTSVRLPMEITPSHSLVECETHNFTNEKLLAEATSTSQLTNPWDVQTWKHKLSPPNKGVLISMRLMSEALECNQYKANK